MILGIVGHADDKFTPGTMIDAMAVITEAIDWHKPEKVVSGGCHLGGVDKWAIEIAQRLGVPTEEFLPANRQWEPRGYKERNLKIASQSDRVLVVVVHDLPPGYRGMKFNGCYHCKDRNPPHVKSGGCWTAWKCKEREWAII